MSEAGQTVTSVVSDARRVTPLVHYACNSTFLPAQSRSWRGRKARVVIFLALLSHFGSLAQRAPVIGSGEQNRPAGIVTRRRGHLLALGRMLEAIKR